MTPPFPLAILRGWVLAQVALLGADDYATREAAGRRLDHPLWVLLLPERADDPEAAARIAALMRKYRPPTQRQIEVQVLDADFDRWVAQYLALNRSAFAREFDFFATEVLNRPEHYSKIFAALPRTAEQSNWNFWSGALTPRDFPAWLDYLDWHHAVAPPPRAK